MNDPISSSTDPRDAAPLPGTVKHYERHVFICTGNTEWPQRIEEGGGFAQALAEEVAPFLTKIALKVKITACDGIGESQGHDILVFPDAIRYVGVRETDLQALVQDHLVANRVSSRIAHRPLSGWHVFVCVHGRRDERCGQCGPPLVERFRVELARRDLADEVTLLQSSHVGGHAFAGNVLVYPAGDWYGYVTPDAVPRIVEQHIRRRRVVTGLWRGRMALSPEEQVAQMARWLDGAKALL